MNWNDYGQTNLIVGILCLSTLVNIIVTWQFILFFIVGVLNVLCFVYTIKDVNAVEGEQ